MFHMLSWIIFGLIVGTVAKLLKPGRDPQGFFVTCGLGVAGSFLGGFLAQAVGWYGPDRSTGGFFMSIAGAILILWIYQKLEHTANPNG